MEDCYLCNSCGYIYEKDNGDDDGQVAPGTAFDKLPSDWVCPVCGSEKSDFTKADFN